MGMSVLLGVNWVPRVSLHLELFVIHQSPRTCPEPSNMRIPSNVFACVSTAFREGSFPALMYAYTYDYPEDPAVPRAPEMPQKHYYRKCSSPLAASKARQDAGCETSCSDSFFEVPSKPEQVGGRQSEEEDRCVTRYGNYSHQQCRVSDVAQKNRTKISDVTGSSQQCTARDIPDRKRRNECSSQHVPTSRAVARKQSLHGIRADLRREENSTIVRQDACPRSPECSWKGPISPTRRTSDLRGGGHGRTTSLAP